MRRLGESVFLIFVGISVFACTPSLELGKQYSAKNASGDKQLLLTITRSGGREYGIELRNSGTSPTNDLTLHVWKTTVDSASGENTDTTYVVVVSGLLDFAAVRENAGVGKYEYVIPGAGFEKVVSNIEPGESYIESIRFSGPWGVFDENNKLKYMWLEGLNPDAVAQPETKEDDLQTRGLQRNAVATRSKNRELAVEKAIILAGTIAQGRGTCILAPVRADSCQTVNDGAWWECYAVLAESTSECTKAQLDELPLLVEASERKAAELESVTSEQK